MASTSAAELSSAILEDYPNWLEMPHELMANIFQRLRTVEILKNAWNVCATWRRICKNPVLWKVVDIYKSSDDRHTCDTNYDLEMLTKQAIDLSCGELIDISIAWFGTDDLLDYIVLRSSKLKRLCLMSCDNITGKGLHRAVKRVPQLEQLRVPFTSINAEDIKVIGRNFPELKSFMMAKASIGTFIQSDKEALAIANHMPELRNLHLFDDEMTNDGLEAILHGCPHLESLDVTMSHKLNLDGNLAKLCMERIKDFKHDSLENWDFRLQIPDMDLFS